MTLKPIIAVVNDWGSVSSALEEHDAHVLDVETHGEMERALKYADAVVLTGGGDIDPARYGAERHSSVYGISPSRDKLEFAAIRMARKRRLPMFGICRGHQLINVAHGGSLIQNVPDLHDHINHGNGEHAVFIHESSSIASRISGMILKGTTLHHQAVDRVGAGLLPIGWAPDGIIEMLESAPGLKPYVLTTQFHPEMDYRSDEDAEAIFAHFVGMVRKYAVGRGNIKSRLERISDLLVWDKYAEKQKAKKRSKSKYASSDWEGDWDTKFDSRTGTTTYLPKSKQYDQFPPRPVGGWDDDEYEYEAWWQRNKLDADMHRLVTESQRTTILDSTRHDQAKECDARCAFPPCMSPSSCAQYGDCHAEAVANAKGSDPLATVVEHRNASLTLIKSEPTSTPSSEASVKNGKRGNPRSGSGRK